MLRHLLKPHLGRILLAALLLLTWSRAQAAPVVTPWTPLFKGIDYLTGTNSQSTTDFSNLMVAYALRINLTDPDIRLLPTPRHTNYQANARETAGRTVSQFVKAYGVQVAVNANFFDPGTYYLPEGTAMVVDGLSISQGNSVSAANFSRAASVLFDANNLGRIVHTNWPATSTNGVLNAVSGDYPILVNGTNISRKYLGGGFVHEVNPRTAIGLSQDGKTLFLICIDGRQPGYSSGAYDYETAAWLLLLGAHDAVNMDGGGSTTMSMLNSAGQVVRLNSSSAVADSGKERTVGSHLGIYARPVPAFINEIAVVPQDESATITWTTTAAASSQLEFGSTDLLGDATEMDPTAVTAHSVTLTGLTPGTGYYYRAVSIENGARHESPIQFFTTTRSVTTTEMVPLKGNWRYTGDNLDGVNWTTPAYNDSGWSGPGAGLLWVNTSASTLDPDLLGEPLPTDNSTGFPYVTYYFRTHFTSPAAGAGTSLAFTGYLDDGAVFYLNGHEIYRLRMPDAPEAIVNSTIANSFPCSGNADCADEFTITTAVSEHLVAGDNVLAVEAHNFSARSPDITFGFAVVLEQAINQQPPQLLISVVDGKPVLNWTGGGFTLQQSDSPEGQWNNVPGPVTSGPFTVSDGATTRFYRLNR